MSSPQPSVSGSWIDWFDSETVFDDPVSETHIDVFVRSTTPLLGYGPDDRVLDIGCGRGLLAGRLVQRVSGVHCADVSRQYLEECRQRFAGNPRVVTHLLDAADYTNLAGLPAEHFSIVICLSVVQYYRDVGEVERLIESVGRIARPGARLLIADIPTSPGVLGKVADVAGLLRSAARERCIGQMVRRLVRMKRSAYESVRSSQGLLTLSEANLSGLIRRMGVDGEVLSTPLTLQPNRRHLLIRY